MFDRHRRRDSNATHRRPRRRPAKVAAEGLEGRQLLAFTPLGFSIPDLAIVEAFTGPVGALGGDLAVTVDVSNLGQSSLPEPLALQPGARSSADSLPTQIDVFFTSRAGFRAPQRVLVGSINVPRIPQNRLARVTGTVTLPEQLPPGLPGTGDVGFLTFVIDQDRVNRDLDRTNNVTRRPADFLLVPNLPDLATTALALPPTLNPGDAVIPEVKVANLGAAPTAPQAPVLVQVVASLDQFLGPGDEVIAEYTVTNIDPLALAPTKADVFGDVNLDDPPNVALLDDGVPTLLPQSDEPYFVGVAVDPFDEILEIRDIDRPPNQPVRLEALRVVADSGLGLPPAIDTGDPSIPTDRPFPLFPFDTPTNIPPGVILRGAEEPTSPGDRIASFRQRLAERAERIRQLRLARFGG